MEAAEDLHIFLNSCFNVREFPLNTSNGFTYVIKPSLALDSSHEVAEENFIFEPDIYSICEGNEKYMLNLTVSFRGSDEGFDIALLVIFQLKLLQQKTFSTFSHSR